MKARAEKEIVKRALAMLHSGRILDQPAAALAGGNPTLPKEIDKGTILAVKIASAVLNADIWLILDRSFVPHDGLAAYFPEELPLLKSKSAVDLRQIHRAKLAFPGCRVIQEGVESKGES